MPEEKTQIERLEDIFNKLDDFEWLVKCIATCHFDDFTPDQFSGAMMCFSRYLFDIKKDIRELIKYVSENKTVI